MGTFMAESGDRSRSCDKNDDGTFLEVKRAFRFTIRDLIYLLLITSSVLIFGVKSYYFHEEWLRNIDRTNAVQDQLVEKMSVTIAKLLEVQNETLGTLRVVIDNQQAVLNKLTRVGVYQQVYRPKKSERSSPDKE